MDKSLSVVVPAYNEEENIAAALEGVRKALEGLVVDYEIIVIDDGSQDKTGWIAQEKAKQDARIICISNDGNKGFGYSYARGVASARKDYIGVYGGDNEGSWESFRGLIENMDRAHIVSMYTANLEDRPWFRQFLSRTFTGLLNALFGMDLRYFNGTFTCRRELLQGLPIRSQGLTALAECKIRLIKQGYSCLEIPLTYIPRSGGRSTALKFKSIKAVLQGVIWLYRDIYWGKKSGTPNNKQ